MLPLLRLLLLLSKRRSNFFCLRQENRRKAVFLRPFQAALATAPGLCSKKNGPMQGPSLFRRLDLI